MREQIAVYRRQTDIETLNLIQNNNIDIVLVQEPPINKNGSPQKSLNVANDA